MEQICEVIVYEGDNSTFIWKHPSEDFNSLTQLIVHESQEAIFFMNGQALDLFGPGRYSLETQNIPRIGGFLKRATDDKTPFHCEVYFINKTIQMGLKWGTDSKVRYIDSDTGVPLQLGASGELSLQVSDSRKLLVKLVGTMNGIAWSETGTNFTQSIQNSFRPLISTVVKSNLTAAIKAANIDILEVDEHLAELSAVLHKAIMPGFEEYGLSIPQFYLTTVVLPEEDPNFKRIRELHTIELQMRMIQAEATVKTAAAQSQAQYRTAEEQSKAAIEEAHRQAELERQKTETEVLKREAERKVIAAQAEVQAERLHGLTEAEIMAAKGYNQKDVLQAEVQKAYAEGIGKMGPDVVNGGGSGSSIVGDMLGLGVGLQAAGAMSPQIGKIFAGMNDSTHKNNAPPVQSPQPSQVSDNLMLFKAKVEKLTIMKEAGLISEEEFAQMKAKLLSDIM